MTIKIKSNTYTAELPDTLAVGDRVACFRWYESPEIVEVVKISADGRVYLMRETGLMVQGVFTVDLLRGFDYKLIKEEVK
ncbi:MAG: hypothetical protein WC364_11970 [Eubacteriales bacterium]|jgi:hypothetical protein